MRSPNLVFDLDFLCFISLDGAYLTKMEAVELLNQSTNKGVPFVYVCIDRNMLGFKVGSLDFMVEVKAL